jgi:hypothetical protein
MSLTPFQRRLRSLIKRFIYSQLYLRESLLILFGRAKPLVRFTVEADPPSVYFNFAIRPDQVESLERELGLPHPLTPIRCLEDEEPFHCITLNVYRVSGLANGMRAEWSLYVRDAGGIPRFVIVEAQADSGSMDPVHIITRAGEVVHAEVDGWLTSEIRSAGGARFKARYRNDPGGRPVRVAPEWVQANDYIYWGNGVCDRTFYDSGLANASARWVDAADVSIEDDTRWGRIADPTPRHVVIFESAIDFSMSPWWNIDDPTP